ncbi:hypothetical protein OEA41_000355 [Lepraria neglecta]|uniref:DRBM domain-containing protein n=1 Tax=Lepraria neglecta TaxID=209136 RepID=A0AAD9ZIU8_9LECA|nr:hypothetical protein OEA41_000355 [Lepraria neglecta]
MAAQYQDLRGAECTRTQKEALNEYQYKGFCQRLGLLNPSILEMAICLDPQLTARKLFEAFIGIARRHFFDQYSGYDDIKQWLSDLESFTHPQVDINEKEVFTPPHQASPGSRIKFSESGTEDLSSNGSSDTFSPPRLPILPQSASPAAHVMAQLSPATSGAVSPMPAEPSSPIVPAVPNRQRELQELSLYTSCLKQYGTKENVDVRYEEKRELPNFPPRFYCRVVVGAFSGEGRGSSKKEAQHRASKALQLTFPEPFYDILV